jgi:hypothetical protein
MPVYSSAEFLAVSAYNSSAKLLLVVIYRPGSVAANSLFFDEFVAVVDRLAVYAMPVVIVGDVNIHLDAPLCTETIKFHDILLSADLVQHVVGPTHYVS